jgi:hypothetical protein
VCCLFDPGICFDPELWKHRLHTRPNSIYLCFDSTFNGALWVSQEHQLEIAFYQRNRLTCPMPETVSTGSPRRSPLTFLIGRSIPAIPLNLHAPSCNGPSKQNPTNPNISYEPMVNTMGPSAVIYPGEAYFCPHVTNTSSRQHI